MSVIQKTYKVNGTLTNLTSATLGITYSGGTICAPGTAMTHAGTGLYTYSWTDPGYGLTYTVTYVFTPTSGQVITWSESFAGPAAATRLELSVAQAVSECSRLFSATDIAAGRPLESVKAAYRDFLAGRNPRTGTVHAWSFMRPLTTITVGAAVTGTATGTTGGVITATTSIFNRSMVGVQLTIADTTSRVVTITAYTSATVVTTDDTIGFSSKTVTPASNGIVALPDGFSSLLEWPRPAYNTTGQGMNVREVKPDAILRDWQGNISLDEPYMFCVQPSQSWDGTVGQRYELWVAPRPLAAYDWLVRYSINPDNLAPLVNDANHFFLGGWEFSETLRKMCMGKAEVDSGRAAGVYHGLAEQALVESIATDKQRHTSLAPPRLSTVDTGLGGSDSGRTGYEFERY